MNRLTKIVLKNLHLVPGTFSKIYWYAAHPDKYSKVQKMKPAAVGFWKNQRRPAISK